FIRRSACGMPRLNSVGSLSPSPRKEFTNSARGLLIGLPDGPRFPACPVATTSESNSCSGVSTLMSMQTAASDAFDLGREPERVRDAYGRGHFDNACLLARRLAERGVRFTQIYCGNGQPWDTHRDHNATTRRLCQ